MNSNQSDGLQAPTWGAKFSSECIALRPLRLLPDRNAFEVDFRPLILINADD
jgi:hypothetical protein